MTLRHQGVARNCRKRGVFLKSRTIVSFSSVAAVAEAFEGRDGRLIEAACRLEFNTTSSSGRGIHHDVLGVFVLTYLAECRRQASKPSTPPLTCRNSSTEILRGRAGHRLYSAGVQATCSKVQPPMLTVRKKSTLFQICDTNQCNCCFYQRCTFQSWYNHA